MVITLSITSNEHEQHVPPLPHQTPQATVITLNEWEETEFCCIPPAGATLSLTLTSTLDSLELLPFLRPGDPAWCWHWNPQNKVGHFILQLQATFADGERETLHHPLNVVPRKIDQEQFHALLDDVQRLLPALLYGLSGSSGAAAYPPHDEQHPRIVYLLEEYVQLCENEVPRLERAIERIARQPHTRLRSQREQVAIDQAHDLSHAAEHLSSGPFVAWEELAYEHGGGTVNPAHPSPYLPANVSQSRSAESFDTPENAMVWQVLNELGQRLQRVAEVATHAAANDPRMQPMVARSHALVQRLHALHHLPFLAATAKAAPRRQSNAQSLALLRQPSLVIRRNVAYRHVYELWQDLHRSPIVTIDSPLFHLPLRELPRLYESWCAIQILHLLLELPGAVVETAQLTTPASEDESDEQRSDQDVLVHDYTIGLVEDTPLISLAWQGVRLVLRYQARYEPMTEQQLAEQQESAPFVSLDRSRHVPDLALELTAPATPSAMLIFDAKYRRTAAGTIPEDALADAYTYLGSIGRSSGERAVEGVGLLYPGRAEPESYASGIALIPLLPGATTHFREWMTEYLHLWVSAYVTIPQ